MNFSHYLRIEDVVERVIEVGPEVHRVFQTDTESEQTTRHTLLALPTTASVDGGFHATEARAPDDQSSDSTIRSALGASFTSKDSIAPNPPISELARSNPGSVTRPG